MVDDEPKDEQLINRGFEEVLRLEDETIRARRRAAGIVVAGDEQRGRPADLFGVALSGGGIRSASFSLGALQALHSSGLIKRIDYLSTVSGGGYIGTSMIAAMHSQLDAGHGECKFPFSRAPQENVRDCEAVSHLRDYSRFLAPRGLKDITLSIAVVLRGLAVNILLLLSFLLPLASVFVLTNPTTATLNHSILLDAANYLLPATWVDWWPPLKGMVSDPFVFSKLGAVCLALWLTGWALRRSHLESFARTGGSLEHNSRGAKGGRWLLIVVAVALVMELQPIVISVVTSDLNIDQAGWFKWLTVAAGAILSFIASFQAKLVVWIQHALNAPSVGARLRSLVAKIALYGAALTLPFMIYAVFLAIVIWGIRPETPDLNAPSALATQSWSFSKWTAIFAVLFFTVDQAMSSAPMARFWYALKAIAKGQFNPWVVAALCVWLVALPVFALATRSESTDSTRDWIVLANYLSLSAAIMIVASAFTENANGLHKLYRDRLRVAYRLWDSAGQPLPLHALPETAPYLLVNATLNVRVPRKDDSQATESCAPSPAPDAPRSPDPAKRGRNAEFFIFSKHAVGSESTRYADPEALSRIQPDLDLAAAAAISGAAVSSSMGRIGIGLLGPTLALLNLRLGFWLPNPSKPRTRDRHWEDIFRLYLFAEAFGRLRADSLRIYVTDGGHIDNIGLYQLLKRRCKFIVVIDGEADPAMNFSAFADVQRFARIDDGTIVSLDWRPLRHAALHRLADRTKTKGNLTDAPRCAVGRILYENGEKGILLYVKAAVRGDEPDYVLDYERRYPTFPHEATSDQFFSEEQMEAYRALGFHSVNTALSAVRQEETATDLDRKSKQPKSDTTAYLVLLAEMMAGLGVANASPAGPRRTRARARRHSNAGPTLEPVATTDLNGIGTRDDNSARTSI